MPGSGLIESGSPSLRGASRTAVQARAPNRFLSVAAAARRGRGAARAPTNENPGEFATSAVEDQLDTLGEVQVRPAAGPSGGPSSATWQASSSQVRVTIDSFRMAAASPT